jgi:hypothetical protein
LSHVGECDKPFRDVPEALALINVGLR